MNEFYSVNYWNERYKNNPQLFDFYGQITLFYPYFESFLKEDSSILILGAGTSREPYWLYDKGFKHIKVVDFSINAVEACQRELSSRPEIDYEIADVKSFSIEKQFDFIFEKGLFDCLLSDYDDPEEELKMALSNVLSYMTNESVLYSVTFDDERDELIEQLMPSTFRIDQIPIQVDVFGVQEKQRVYLYELIKK